MKHLFVLLFLCAFFFVKAQDTVQFYMGVEYGRSQLKGNIDQRWIFSETDKRITTDGSVHGDGQIYYWGLRSEFSMWRDRLTISSALRYIRVNDGFFKLTYLYQPAIQEVDFIHIYKMDESLGYIGVPLEVEMALLSHFRDYQVYIKGGIQAGLKIHGNRRIGSYDDDIIKYEDKIFTMAGKAPSNFLSTIYGAIGFRIGADGFSISAELVSPHFFLSKNNFSILTPQTYPGLHCTVSLPFDLPEWSKKPKKNTSVSRSH